jgi:hypothetical protein
MANWSFARWMRESRSYMAHLSAWKFYPRAVLRWPSFDWRQRLDAKMRPNVVHALFRYGRSNYSH